MGAGVEGESMGLVADIYGMEVNEAMMLTDTEAEFLLEKAQITMMGLATTSPAMQEILRGQLAPTLRAVRAAREQRPDDNPVGPPPI
jgi:hypothetical protein